MSPISVIVGACWAVVAVGLVVSGVLEQLAWRRADEPSEHDPEFAVDERDTRPGTDPDLLRACEDIHRMPDHHRREDER